MLSLPPYPHSPLLSLAPELIEGICHQLDLHTLKQLRLTCKYLADLLSRVVLVSLSLKITKSTVEKGLSKLTTLSTGNPAIREGAKKLRIGSLSASNDSDSQVTWKWDNEKKGWVADAPPEHPLEAVAEEIISAHLFNAITSMKALENIEWDPDSKDSESTHKIVMEALKALPNLRRIHICVTWLKIPLDLESITSLQDITMDEISESLQVEIFEGLARAVAHNPGISSLETRNTGRFHRDVDEYQSLHQLFKYYPKDSPPLRLRDLRMTRSRFRLDEITIPHLRHLTSLDLIFVQESGKSQAVRQSENSESGVTTSGRLEEMDSFGSTLEDVWTAFRVANIQLQSISIDVVPNSFLDYLASYSGLKELHVVLNTFRNRGWSDTLASRFYEESLGNHVQSLEKLALSTSYEGLWCIGANSLKQLGRCANMQYLCVSVNCSELPAPSKDDQDHKEPELSEFVPNLITTLIDIAVTHMPNIKFIRIMEAAIMNCCYARPCAVHSVKQVSSRVTTEGILADYIAPPSCRSLPSLTMNSLMGRRIGFVGSSIEDNGSPRLKYVLVGY